MLWNWMAWGDGITIRTCRDWWSLWAIFLIPAFVGIASAIVPWISGSRARFIRWPWSVLTFLGSIIAVYFVLRILSLFS
jgi:hypothetical protein